MNSEKTDCATVGLRNYPVLKITRRPLMDWVYIVLFTAPKCGVVVNVVAEGRDDATSHFKCELGEYHDGFNEDEFVPYDGVISIKN